MHSDLGRLDGVDTDVAVDHSPHQTLSTMLHLNHRIELLISKALAFDVDTSSAGRASISR
ncbi:hypothetical protein AGR6A_pAt50077 [Agrobacterium sp. NCPPB 925]|nr:hypothetical protein AGR6A_pAt50077 [Agrobacterium sp. NCPPB 925]